MQMMQFKSTKGLIGLLEDASTSSQSIHKIAKPIFKKVGEELFGDEDISWKSLSIVLDLLQSIQFVIRHHKGCFATLDSAGLSDFLSAMLKRIILYLRNNGCERDLPIFIESCTETIVAVADAEQTAKSKMVSEQMVQLFDLIQTQSLVFKTKLEVLRSVNMLLEQCPLNVKECILEKSDTQQKITSLVEMVSSIGDYEFQVCIIECLMRIFPRKARQKYAEMFIQETTMKEEFMMIRDKVFETDCRLFLNNVNARNDDPTKGVYSFPCVKACIGMKQLRKPDDPNYEEFWVDFNLGSSRITIFCEQEGRLSQGSQIDESLWETIEISKANIKKYAIDIENDNVSLEFHLKNSLNQLYPSQQYSEQSGSCITIKFVIDLEDHVAHAVRETFKFEKKKAKVSTVEFPLQISVKDQESHEDRRQDVRQSVNSQDQSSQSGVTNRRKVSIPNAPLKLTPDDSISGSSEHKTDISEGNKVPENKTQKTPTMKSKNAPRVKTPVVEISSPVKKTDGQKSSKNKKKKETKKKAKKIVSKQEDDTIIPETQQCVEENYEQNKNETANTSEPDNQKADNCGVRKKSSIPSIPMNQALTAKPAETYKTQVEVSNEGKENEALTVKPGELGKTEQEGSNKGKENVDSTVMEEEVVKESQLSQHNGNSSLTDKCDPELQEEADTSPNDDTTSVCEEMKNNKISAGPDLQEGNKTLNPLKDVIEEDSNEVEDQQKETDPQSKNRINSLKKLSKQKSEEEVNNFGFDELDNINRIPESLEQVTDCAASVIKGYSKVCSEEKKSKQDREQLKNNCNNRKELFKNDSNQGKEEIKNSNKHGEEQVKNNDKQGKEQFKNNDKQGKEQIQNVSKNNHDEDQIKKQKSHTYKLLKRNKQTEKTKSFADVNKSLKELCDLDEKENLKRDNNLKKKNEMTEERKPLSQEEIDHLYTFTDPDLDTCTNKVKEKSSKPPQKANSASSCVKEYATKTLKVTGHKQKTNKISKASKSKTETMPKKGKKESKDNNGNSNEIDTCFAGNRTLRHRKTKPNYIEAPSTDGDGISEIEIESSASGDNQNILNDQSVKTRDENGLFSSPNREIICNGVLPDRKVKSNVNKENSNVGKIVTVNSDDSNMESSQNIANQINSSDSENGDNFRAERYEESIIESLYVESDDSCNARSYKLNYKDRKRRSSLKHKEQKQQLSTKLIDNKSKSINSDGHKGMRRDESKSSRKSVSFDDSVLKDLSPIQKESYKTNSHNLDSSLDKLSHKSKTKSASKEEEKSNKQTKEKKVISPDNSPDKRSRKEKRKKTVQASYSKLESKTRPWSKLQELSKTKLGSGYDPFDFEAQTDNASNRSERLDRHDMSKTLNEKHSGRKKEPQKSNKQKSRSVKKETHDSPENSSPGCDTTENNPPMLMVQDQQTKKWHRSSDLAKKNVGIYQNVRKEKMESSDKHGNEADKCSSLSLSPLHIESDKPLQCVEKCRVSDDSDVEQNNTFKKILRDIECSRQKAKEQKAENYFQTVQEEASMQDHDHISPIQTPYLSCASTPKISSGRRKQYTPLNISVIKTPQSAASEKDDSMSWQNHTNESLLLSTDKNGDTSHPSEKSWILSRKKEKKLNKKKQATYKVKRKERPQKYYKREESDYESDGSEEEEVINTEANKYSEMLRSLIKPCMIKLDDIVFASGVNDKNDETSETANSSVIQAPVYKQKSKNLEDVILTPYTPVKEDCIDKNEDTFTDIEQTQDDLSVDLSDQDDESSHLYNLKQQKLMLLGDSGYHSGPSSAVKRLSSSSLKRKYPLSFLVYLVIPDKWIL